MSVEYVWNLQKTYVRSQIIHQDCPKLTTETMRDLIEHGFKTYSREKMRNYSERCLR